MSTQNRLVAAATIAAALALLGCNNHESKLALPEANNANCEPEKVALIPDKDARNRFIDLCAKRNNYRPSTPRGW